MKTPALSVVIPVYNEEDGLIALFARLYPVPGALGTSYKVMFVNDGSCDRPAVMLAEQFRTRPGSTRVVLFNSNYGQHMAILAGFEHARGERVATLDVDLQNPPEEVGRLVEKFDGGYDYVGTIRRVHQDSWFRRTASRTMNSLRERITYIKMTDQGCMLYAYNHTIVDTISRCCEVNTFIPALAYAFSKNPTEIEVDHEERLASESKYSLYEPVCLNFDLVTGFSVVLLQWFSAIGMLLSSASAVLFILLVIRRLVLGAEVQGVFTLFAITFFLMGVLLFGIDLPGEYIGRIYQQVRERPHYLMQGVLGETSHLHETGAADLKTGSQRGVV